jgi:hypothetical protein
VTASCATTARFVFLTESTIVSSSSGCSVRGSTTSTETPFLLASSARASDSWTSRPVAITVTSSPSRWNARLADRDRLQLLGHVLLEPVQRAVLEEDDRVVVVDRRPEQAADVGRRRREQHLEPGMCTNHASSCCACCAPGDQPAPPCVRIVTGTFSCPPDMYRCFAAWLTICSVASVRKSSYMTSTTGRMPCIAAPMPVPDERHLGDRRVPHALRAELVEHALRDAHRAAHLGDVLAHDEDVVVLSASPATARRGRPLGS